MKKLAVVILNWNGLDFLRRFLPSVAEHSKGEHIALWIADNGSEDGSVDFVREEYPMVNILELGHNYGFALGYNKAFNAIEAEYYLLLNSDIEVTEGWTEPLLRLMESNSGIAACMPKIKDLKKPEYFEHAGAAGGFIDFLGYPFCRGRIFDYTEKDNGQYDDICDVFWASGACMMVRAGDWHDAGGFDEMFFAHMEEIDLCWRLRARGRNIVSCPSSVVYHLGGGTLPAGNPRKIYLNFRNSLLMLLKNVPASRFHIIIIRLFFDWLSVMKFVLSCSFRSALAIIKAHAGFFRLVPVALRRRKETGHRGYNNKDSVIYHRSIVFDFFLLKKKFFTSLRFDK